MVDLMVAAWMDGSESITMDVPTRALAYLATRDDPMRYAGKIVIAEALVAELGL